MNEINSRLKGWSREYVLAHLAQGAAQCFVWVGGAIFTSVLLDAAFGLPRGVRWGLLGAIAATGAAGGYRLILTPLLRLNPAELLREASRRYIGSGPYLLSAWELSRTGAGPASDALAQRHIEEAQRYLSQQPSLPVYAVRLSRQSKRGLAWLAVVCGVSLPWLDHRSPGIGRILAPWKEIALEQVWDIAPGDKRMAWGTSVAITARNRRVLTREAVDLWLRTQGAPWSRFDWDSEAQGIWSYSIAELNRPIEYQLRWRGERSRTYRLEPVPFPQLIDAKARIHLPGHLRPQEAQAEIGLEGRGEVAALAGSWVVIHGRPSVPLSHASVQVSYLNSPVDFRSNSIGEFETGFPLTQDGSFRFDLVSAEGLSDPHPISYRLKALVDQPPAAEILSPAFEVEASPREKLPITYEVRDDYGLAAVDLVYRLVEGGAAQVVPVLRFSGGGARMPTEYIADYAWDLSGLPLGSRVEFQIRATDNNIVRPQLGFSGKAFVRLVDFEGAHGNVEREWLATAKKIDELVAKEQAARADLNALSNANSPEEKTRREARWAAMDKDLVKAWEEGVRSFQEFADSMSKDPYANPALAEQAKIASENMKQAKEETLPAASQEARERKWNQAEKLHQFLEDRARRAAKMLSQGRELQAMQDFWQQSQRMDQAGKELASSLSEMAQKPGKISEQDRRQLEQALAKLQEAMQAMAKELDSLPKPKTDSAADRRKVFVVPVNSARHMADALQQALAAGDYAKAAQIAQRMAEELGKTRQAIADAARSAAQDSGLSRDQDDALSKKMEKTMSQWQKAIDEQSRSLAMAQKLEEGRTKALLEAQRKLLEDLAVRQKLVVDAAAGLGDLVFRETQNDMRAILDEFTAKAVVQAPQLLERTLQTLRARALGVPNRKLPLEKLSRQEQGILDDLNKGVKPPPPSAGEAQGAAAAEGAQGRAQGETADLRDQLESMQQEGGELPSSISRSVSGAQSEQGQARSALKGMDFPGAIQREEKALGLLQQGKKDMASAMESRQDMGSAAMKPFSSSAGAIRPAGPRGNTGSDTSFVPLPSAEDYKPPREIREDVEKSLQERRPHSYDGVIKDYFKRISE